MQLYYYLSDNIPMITRIHHEWPGGGWAYLVTKTYSDVRPK